MTAPPGIGARLRTLREATGHTRAYVAAQLHVVKATITNYELGNRQPTYTTVEQYLAAIGMTIHIGPAEQAHTDTSSKEKP